MIILCIYIGIYFLQLPFIYAIGFADSQSEFPNLAKKDYRKDMAFNMGYAMFVSLFPIIGFIMILLLTGFAQHGLKWK